MEKQLIQHPPTIRLYLGFLQCGNMPILLRMKKLKMNVAKDAIDCVVN